ncbi:glycosyltransferase family 4 protein [Terriglobus roseus]|uniref:Glycosyltransferase involved in cell wall bisynthesis n=1 Tax=Terriglobus roseus TaxID=392734 RepID=A0A1H4M2X8_9BACT|nr:glycosyltransferase [Terriglobus roseus]SEB77389.1 Glycosyltransferase involved in cell wall bisynthesis [Terriglobus roseus]
MKIIQATFGVFHHFELARELNRRGHLERIYSTFPWKRLEREGVPHDKVETFPWLHTPQLLLSRKNLLPQALRRTLSYRVATTYDTWIARRMPPCDALIALSGAGLKAGKLLQSRGGVFLCDRGSTHHAYQSNILREEYRIWNVPYPSYDPRVEPREIEIYEQADAIVVPSQVCRDSFLQQGVAPDHVHVIPYGVRLDRFHPDGAPSTGPDAPFEVLFVGGVSLRKGIPYLLKAFAALPHPNKRLRVIGSLDPNFAPLLATLPQENVEFLGSLPQPQLVAYMSRSHVMVLPSIEEGLALVQGQALACGCPIIASTATGSEDLFTDGVEGFIVPIRSVQAITDRLQCFVDDPTLRDRMSAAALKRVKSFAGWSEYGDRWEALLHQLTQTKKR